MDPVLRAMIDAGQDVYTGWRHDPQEVGRVVATMPHPRFASAAPDLAGTGAGKTVLLYKAFKEVNGGSYIPYVAQAIGDCVSMGFGHGIDLLEAVQISLGKKAEEFHQTATEAVYGMARVDIGGEHDYQDGAVGAWAAKAVSTIGTVNRDVVGPYSGQRAKDWGAHGVPDSIKAKAGDHKVKTASLVATTDDAHDALANGYPVPVCSDQGFTLQRDERGACRPRGSWSHCMLICGVRVNADGSREFCIFQSWGPQMPTGPLSDDQPPNSFWIDDRTMGSMLRMQDSFALSGFIGYPGQPIPDSWSYTDAA